MVRDFGKKEEKKVGKKDILRGEHGICRLSAGWEVLLPCPSYS